MLICVSLSAIFALTLHSALATIATSESSPLNTESGFHTNLNKDILAILSSPYHAADSEETNYEDLDDSEPRITVWEFPSERRAFIGDVEVFVDSEEDNSNEEIDPQNTFIKHPHKDHELHKDLGFEDEQEFPTFRVKSRRNNYEREMASQVLKQIINSGPDGIVKYLSTRSAGVNVRDKREIRLNNKNIVSDLPKNRHRREWGIVDYLRWLLRDLKETPSTESPSTIFNDENKKMDDIDKEISNIQDEVEKNIKNQDILAEILSDKKIQLQPVHPDLLNDLQEQFKDEKGKRSIDSKSNLNSLLGNSIDKDDNENGDKNDDNENLHENDDIENSYKNYDNENDDKNVDNKNGDKNVDNKNGDKNVDNENGDEKIDNDVDNEESDELVKDFFKILQFDNEVYNVLIAVYHNDK